MSAPEGGQRFGGPGGAGAAGGSWSGPASGGGAGAVGARSGAGAGGPQNIATAVTDVSERVVVLVREEVELAKAEVTEKVSRLARGAVVAAVAGVFFVTALFFVLIGCAWLLYYYLPIGSEFTYFVGFFAMAVILVVLGTLAGLVAAKALKKGAVPVPTMALEEARLIRETMSAGSESATGAGPAGAASAGARATSPFAPPSSPPGGGAS